MHGFTMENLARDVQMKFLLDCWKDFYTPTVRQRDIFQRLYQNMLDGRCDALFMLDQGNKRDLMDGKDFKTTNFYHPATDTAVYVRSEFGAWGTHDNYHWYCYVGTDERALGARTVSCLGMVLGRDGGCVGDGGSGWWWWVALNGATWAERRGGWLGGWPCVLGRQPFASMFRATTACLRVQDGLWWWVVVHVVG